MLLFTILTLLCPSFGFKTYKEKKELENIDFISVTNRLIFWNRMECAEERQVSWNQCFLLWVDFLEKRYKGVLVSFLTQKILFSLYLSVCVCARIRVHINTSESGCQRNPLELEIQVVESHLTWVLELRKTHTQVWKEQIALLTAEPSKSTWNQ